MEIQQVLASLGHDVSHGCAHAPGMNPEQKQGLALASKGASRRPQH